VAAITGVSATGTIGTVAVRVGISVSLTGVAATGNIGAVSVTTTIFDYNAVAALYDRSRAVLVERKSTGY